jgi:hypothetical protein
MLWFCQSGGFGDLGDRGTFFVPPRPSPKKSILASDLVVFFDVAVRKSSNFPYGITHR